MIESAQTILPQLRRCAVTLSFTILVVAFFIAPNQVLGQQADQPLNSKGTSATQRDKDESPSLGEMVVKQQISRRRKEHDELLKRGDEALRLSEELEKSFSVNESLGAPDLEKLEALEKVVSRIRKDLGGGDDEDRLEDSSGKENSARQSIAAGFRFLLDSTRSLVDELKRTSRFSISALAIQTSNTVIRFARFLRIRK